MTAGPIGESVEDRIAAINQIELEVDKPETEASDLRYEQAREIVMLLDAGMTQRGVAAVWFKSDGSTYSQAHVMYTAATWRKFEHLSVQDRPRWNEAFNSADVRGRKPDPDGDEWYTPAWLFDALGLVFDIDVCAPTDRTWSSVPARRFFTEDDDGLAQPWEGLVWCNPPYSSPADWAGRMVAHGDGLLLSHVPMNASWCVDVWQACAGIRLFQGIDFIRPDGTSQRPGYWLQLAAFGPTAAAALSRLDIPAGMNPRRVPSPMWTRA